MAKTPLIDIDVLRQLVDCDPTTGNMLWKERSVDFFSGTPYHAARACRSWNAKFAGKPSAAGLNSYGYLRVSILGARHMAHRVVWAMSRGAWPVMEIDHINGIRNDNRISNLRDVNRVENSKNTALHKSNTSGQIGVARTSRCGRWRAYIVVDDRYIHLGQFKKLKDAIAARKAAEVKYGYHENHGRPA